VRVRVNTQVKVRFCFALNITFVNSTEKGVLSLFYKDTVDVYLESEWYNRNAIIVDGARLLPEDAEAMVSFSVLCVSYIF